jgi:ribosome-associated heat shock protein Hsp15
VDEARVDQWLWAVRLYKTRSQATAGVRGGHVKINGAAAKPASRVKVGDRIQATIHDIAHDVEVVQILLKRVGAPVAAQSYVDHSPPVERERRLAPLFPREAGAGRPTKRDRRQLDRLRGN